MKNSVVGFVAIICMVISMAGCSNYVNWQEEVKFIDGRTIVISQKRTCESAYTGGNFASCIAREAWLTVNLPEFSSSPIVWHEHLHPIILNVYHGNLYLVAMPPTEQEFHDYGGGRFSYFGFIWNNVSWKRISFSDIPSDIYNSNLVVEGVPESKKSNLTLDDKNKYEMRGGKPVLHIDPEFMPFN